MADGCWLWVATLSDGHQYCVPNYDGFCYCTDPEFRHPDPGSPFYDRELVEASKIINFILSRLQNQQSDLKLRFWSVPGGIMLARIDPRMEPLPPDSTNEADVLRADADPDAIEKGLGLGKRENFS